MRLPRDKFIEFDIQRTVRRDIFL